MMKIYQFFRLIRFTNLLVIALSMFVVQIFLLKYNTTFIPENYIDYSVFGHHYVELMNFLWLIISTVLIAASGNIINDYFDVKADRVNKPNRLIIDKYIKRRWAMMFHWIFSSVGFIIALGIGYKLQNVWVPLIAFASINLLWFYSAYYKRRPLIGNIIVALLIGILPIYVMLYNWPIKNVVSNDNYLYYSRYFIDVIVIVSVLAFLQNLVRELIKDIQDVRGDLKLGARTFPIKYGIKKTKWLIVVVAMLILFNFYFFNFKIDSWHKFIFSSRQINFSEQLFTNQFYFIALLFASFLLVLMSLILILIFNKSKTYKIASLLMKFAMLFGLLTPLFL